MERIAVRNTLYRQWATLRAIPRHPHKITVAKLAEKLCADGDPGAVSRRTLERDLHSLAEVFPIEQTDQDTKPTGWRWRRGAKVLDVPALDLPAALTFSLAGTYLRNLLPQATLADLEPYLATADAVLRHSPTRLGRWPSKVRVIGRGQPLKAPVIDATVQRLVYEGVLGETRLGLTYAVKGERTTKTYGDVNPLAIVVKEKVVYLLCTMWDYTDVRQLVLHRVKSAELLSRRATRVPGFDLDAYIASGEFGVTSGVRIRLEALFDRHAAAHLGETPLADDQVLAEEGSGRVRVRATVADTQELRWWLLAFGAQVEVIRPIALRHEMAAEAAAMARRYGRPSSRTAGTGGK
jgi:predicted DNA-binding transcriptional regulator YafY